MAPTMLPPTMAPGPAVGAPAAPPAPRARARMGDGLLVGLAATGVGGLAWWALATTTEFAYWQALAAVMGVIVGFGVRIGTRRGGAGPAVLAFVLAALAIPVVVYFIDRTFLIQALADDGQLRTVPLWNDLDGFVDATDGWIDFEPVRALGWALGPLAAALVAGLGGRR